MAPARKSSNAKNGLVVTLAVPPARLRELLGVPPEKEKEDSPAKEDTPAKDEAEVKDADTKDKGASTPADANASPQASGQPAGQANGETVSDSSPSTPAASGTPGPMAPPGKKGNKRAAPTGEPKSRGKPGPKKRARVDDGTGEGGTGRGGVSHKLGPRANQGAINAGLRALDRSGKPCRKWARGGFKLKSFTGAMWEIPRWKAPQKPVVEEVKPDGESAGVSANGSNKENKDEGMAKGDGKSDSKSGVDTPSGGVNGVINGVTNGVNGLTNGVTNGVTTNTDGDSGANGQDVEMSSAPSIPASSPAPVPVATAS